LHSDWEECIHFDNKKLYYYRKQQPILFDNFRMQYNLL
jgi:hypothetical protein